MPTAAFTNAGWSYRTNERGWVVYRDPRTGLWHTRAEATAIVETEADLPRPPYSRLQPAS